MCGIVGLHLKGTAHQDRLGALLTAMLGQVAERGPASTGIGLYGDPLWSPDGHGTVSVLGVPATPAPIPGGRAVAAGETLLVQARSAPADLAGEVRRAYPRATISGHGRRMAVLKGVGTAHEVAAATGLAARSGYQAVGHTRMATESAVTPAHAHPFSVREDLCVVHNGSFANHATIRRELEREGAAFDTDNDSEVVARYIAARLDEGADLEKALKQVCEVFDGFYTLLVTTATEFAVVRDVVSCKPALIAETAEWVAMASEYRALAVLPGIEAARVSEPEGEEVYLWST
jgi:glutamate synthase domain-containing protein 1